MEDLEGITEIPCMEPCMSMGMGHLSVQTKDNQLTLNYSNSFAYTLFTCFVI